MFDIMHGLIPDPCAAPKGSYVFVGVVGSDYCRRARRLWGVWGSTFSYRVEFSFGRDGVVGSAVQTGCVLDHHISAHGSIPVSSASSCNYKDQNLGDYHGLLRFRHPAGAEEPAVDERVIFCFSVAHALSVLHVFVTFLQPCLCHT
jgi:hypothetical protein